MAHETSAQREPISPPNVHNGTFTVKAPGGQHLTVKLHTAQKGALAGKRILSLLTGPDNVSDYRGVAFWNDESKTATVWKKHRGAGSTGRIDAFRWNSPAEPNANPIACGMSWSKVEQKLAIWCDLAVRGKRGFWHSEGYRLLLAGRCVVCNRKLTTPESIESGIGPVCAGRVS